MRGGVELWKLQTADTIRAARVRRYKLAELAPNVLIDNMLASDGLQAGCVDCGPRYVAAPRDRPVSR